jgi:hypothetical protein
MYVNVQVSENVRALEPLFHALANVYTNLLFFFVLLIAVTYKFSVSMLTYLMIFLVYYYYIHIYFNRMI